MLPILCRQQTELASMMFYQGCVVYNDINVLLVAIRMDEVFLLAALATYFFANLYARHSAVWQITKCYVYILY